MHHTPIKIPLGGYYLLKYFGGHSQILFQEENHQILELLKFEVPWVRLRDWQRLAQRHMGSGAELAPSEGVVPSPAAA